MPAVAKRQLPTRVALNRPSLERVGIELVDPSSVRLRCRDCGQLWSPNLGTGGQLPRGWWRCPNGCNAPGGT